MAHATRRKSASGCLNAIEAAYSRTTDDATWLTGMLEALEPALDAGLGMCAYTYNAKRAPIEVQTFVERGGFPISAESTMRALSHLPDTYISETYRKLCVGPASKAIPFAAFEPAKELLAAGIYDALVLNAYDPSSGEGVWIGAALPSVCVASSVESVTLRRVAAHVATALRLRRRTDIPTIDTHCARAIYCELEAEHVDDKTRSAISEAVRSIARARGPLRERAPVTAVAEWRALVDARYSLVDWFEDGGRRYLLAVENPPTTPSPEVLSEREQQILASLAAGRSTKLAAYELGISDSTVRVLLTRAARKLDAKSRSELMAIYVAHCNARQPATPSAVTTGNLRHAPSRPHRKWVSKKRDSR